VNPTATPEQRELEALALRILDTDEVAQAREMATQRWKIIVGADMTPAAAARFDGLIDEHVFGNVLRAVNSDPNQPRVLSHFYGPPHRWFGMDVPGSRSTGGDGPDNTYALIPVDDHARYEITGRRGTPASTDAPLTVINLAWSTLGSLDWSDVDVGPDGEFRITIGPESPDTRRGHGHVQTKLGTSYLLLRDCRSDWRQQPNRYTVTRLDAPTAPPRSDRQLAELAAQYIVMDVPPQYWFLRPFAAATPNTIPPLFNTGEIGGLVSQQSTWARFSLDDGDAFIFTLAHGGAGFYSVSLYDPWVHTIEYWERTSSMNNAQSDVIDGVATYVISLTDPGVHNWLDPGGCREPLMITRLQVLPDPDGEPPSATGRLVRRDELDRHLPDGMRRCNIVERRAQIAERRETFALRFSESNA
jgi:hypothetical protein